MFFFAANREIKGKIVFFFITNVPLAAILNFRFSPNSFPANLSPRQTSVPNFKRSCQHLQVVERE
jgi:hypothetical protein